MNLLKFFLEISIGFLLAYLSFYLPKITFNFIFSAKSQLRKKIYFLSIFILRYFIYFLIMFIGFIYLKINPIFVIIYFTLFFLIILTLEFKKIRMGK